MEHLNTLALGLLAANIAFIGADLAAQADLGHRWWWPIPGFVVSAAICVLTCGSTAKVGLGPSPVDFYNSYGATPTAQANAALLALLGKAIDDAPERQKKATFTGAFFVLFATMLACLVIFLA